MMSTVQFVNKSTYPVFVLSYLLHLEPLGALTLGHLPGHLRDTSTRAVSLRG